MGNPSSSMLGNPSSSMLSRRVNFRFAFNDATFSDRVLRLEIIDDSFDSISYSKGGWKRKRKDSESCTVVKVISLNISSLLLAGNSPYFHKLFKNGMIESKQRDAITLRISASEEAGAMEVLNFMYSNTLKATSTSELLGVLVVAVKFEATECVRYCCESLQKMPISLESALSYVKLRASVAVSALVQPLIDAAKKHLLAQYKDIEKSKVMEEAMALPLSAVEVLLGSDELQACEDDVFEFMLKWGRAQYPEQSKRRDIFTENMSRFLRFPALSSTKVKEVLVCPDLDRVEVTKLMLEAFITLFEDPYEEYGQTIRESHTYPVIKLEQYGTPRPRCVVYFDLKKEDCENLFPSSHVNSHSFCLGGRCFYLSARCHRMEQRHSFGLYLNMTKGSQSCTVDFEFEAIKKSSMKFQNKRMSTQIKYSDNVLLGWGFDDLLYTPWSDFVSKDSEYFIGGILRLRADITIKD